MKATGYDGIKDVVERAQALGSISGMALGAWLIKAYEVGQAAERDRVTVSETGCTPSAEGNSELADQLEALAAKATPGPWAWDQRGEKINEWALGTAFDANEKQLSGRFTDEDAIYDEQVCSTEGATVNYTDPDLICELRNNLPAIIAALRCTPSHERRITRDDIIAGAKKRQQDCTHGNYGALEFCQACILDEAIALMAVTPSATASSLGKCPQCGMERFSPFAECAQEMCPTLTFLCPSERTIKEK